MAELSAGAWGLSAFAAAVETGLLARLAEPGEPETLAAATGLAPALVRRLLEVLLALGVVERRDGGFAAAAGVPTGGRALDLLRADLRATILQTADLAASARSGSLSLEGWRHTDEVLLQAQGTMSAGAVDFLQHQLFPAVPGIVERLEAASATFLDVGAGVGAVTIELCRRYPALRAVALEPASAPLALAHRNVAAAGLEQRVELRAQLVQELADDRAFDIVWLPANFLPIDVLREALAVVHRALRPGGLVLLATLGGGGEDLASATARLRSALWGSDAVEPERVVALLEEAGYVDVVVMDRLPSRLRPIHARRVS